jgi:general stress protein 26
MTDQIKKEALEFARKYPISHLATVENGKPVIRVMSVPRIDDDFTIWYATSGTSNKVRQIKAQPGICSLFYNEGKTLRVFARAEIVDDQAVKDELWQEDWAQYFPKGKNDPNLAIIKAIPEHADYDDLSKSDVGLFELL